MNWNDYEAVWKRQELPVGATADLATLKQTFEAKSRKLARRLFWRDLLEAAAGVIVAGLTAHQGWRLGKAGWPIALAVVLILGVSVFFIMERIRARRERMGPDAPLLAKLDADIAELRHQRRLLLNMGAWYILPCVLAIVIFRANSPAAQSQSPFFVVCYTAVVAFICWRVWAMNRRAVRKKIDPLLEELEKLHRELLSSE
jgi:hypothetical protein